MSDRIAKPSDLQSALHAGRLRLPAVLCTAIGAAAPLTVIAGVVTTGYAETGLIGIPIAFVAVALVLACFTPGYLAMNRTIGNSGAFYSFVSAGLGRPAGVAAAFTALLAYNALQVGLYGILGPVTQPLLQQIGIDVPWWVISVAAWALVALLGVLSISISGRVITWLLAAEIAVICLFTVGNLAHPADGTLALASLDPGNLIGPGAGAVLVLGILAFVGFEAPAVYSEETRDPHRTIPAATYLAIGVVGLLYTVGSWALASTVGPDHIAQRSAEQGQDLLFTLAAEHFGETVSTIGRVLLVTSLLVAAIAFHNTPSRYLFALGREKVLPARCGDTWRRTDAPIIGSITQSALGITVIVVYAAAGWDPLVTLFYWAGTAGGLGILILLTATSLAVLAHLLRQTRAGNHSRVTTLITTTLASAFLVTIVIAAGANLPSLFGVTADSPIVTAVLAAYLVTILTGLAWALNLRRSRPAAYRAIGLGAKTDTVTDTERTISA